MKQSVISKQQSFLLKRTSLSNHKLLSKRTTVPVVCAPVTWWLFGHNVCIQMCPTLCSLDVLFNFIYLLEAAKLCCIPKISLPFSSSSISLSLIPCPWASHHGLTFLIFVFLQTPKLKSLASLLCAFHFGHRLPVVALNIFMPWLISVSSSCT